MLLLRCIIGTIGFTSITFGVAMVPLLVQNTIFNTAPFWAALLGFFFLGEVITSFEIFAMIVSFGGVVLIALSNSATGSSESADTAAVDTIDYSSGKQILGCCLIFLTSLCYAFVSIVTRKMQSMHFAVMLFYYSVVAVVASATILLVESYVK